MMMKLKLKMKNFWQDIFKFPSYLIFHPFDGFYELKRERKGKIWVGVTFLVLFVLFRIYQYLNESIIINYRNPNNLNTMTEILTVGLVFGLFVLGNWSVTTLLSGKGKMRDIFLVTSYALFPIILIGFPAVFISNYLTIEEMGLYTLTMGIAYVAAGWMLFLGILNIHEYGLLKTIITFVLTVVAMAFMAFLGLLFFDVIQRVIAFITSIYDELRLR
ncbi:MAG: YIP1 family protein [Bacilli bacterium]|nr:YIP1 family protein [Bacilli bacterium]